MKSSRFCCSIHWKSFSRQRLRNSFLFRSGILFKKCYFASKRKLNFRLLCFSCEKFFPRHIALSHTLKREREYPANMNGRGFAPIDDLSNAFSLLSPRPFTRQAQYSTVNSSSSSSSSSQNVNVRKATDSPTHWHEPSFGRRTPQQSLFDGAFADRQHFMDPTFGRSSPRMTPLMPEWGFVGEPQSQVFDTNSPSRGIKERIIPIRVEGNKPSPVLEKQGSLQSTVSSVHRENSAVTSMQREQAPISSTIYSNKRDESPRRATGVPLDISLGQAPNLSSRLAGKTTTFDEFADVLSHLPNRPAPKKQSSLDQINLSQYNKVQNNVGASHNGVRSEDVSPKPSIVANSYKTPSPKQSDSPSATQNKVHFVPTTGNVGEKTTDNNEASSVYQFKKSTQSNYYRSSYLKQSLS